MGDISRHRDIYLNTREAIPPNLLAACKLTVADLTYLELGNYFTDVSQFRDPVSFIFGKQRIWREKVLKATDENAYLIAAKALAHMAAFAGAAAIARWADPKFAPIPLAISPILAGANDAINDALADLKGADDWIDQLLGTPVDRTLNDPKKRDVKHYGLLGQFFRYFIEGITHLLFADDITNKVKGGWGRVDRIPATSVSAVFEEFFTQYYPHEHTDQPPYVWDASKRQDAQYAKWYAPSKRQHDSEGKDLGVMNAVDEHYVHYLSEGLSDLEQEWRTFKAEDKEARRKWLLRMGKLLHGIEDWYFHSNVVELVRLRGHRPAQGGTEKDEDFLQRFVRELSEREPEFRTAERTEKLRLRRRLYRRLRFPVYDPGTKTNSAGILSKTKSTPSLRHAYPAFPSQQDTAHTLMHPLKNLEEDIRPSGGPPTLTSILEALPWVPCVLQKLAAVNTGSGANLLREKAKARGVPEADLQRNPFDILARLPRDQREAVIVDVLREWIPLVLTMLNESERKRLLANVDPLDWPVGGPPIVRPRIGVAKDFEIEQQLNRHKKALEPKNHEDGITENNYERTARFLVECEFLNAAGQKALVKAFQIDQKSDKLLEAIPGTSCGGFLMQFALELQQAVDLGERETANLNRNENSLFKPESDNKAFNENIGSHSLMSKDTLKSAPFFNDAKVLASVASQSVFHIMLEEVITPASATGLNWKKILHYFIRFPTASDGWERRAIAFFRDDSEHRIPKFTDLPELAQLKTARLPISAIEALRKRTLDNELKKDSELKEKYIELEAKLAGYRYPG